MHPFTKALLCCITTCFVALTGTALANEARELTWSELIPEGAMPAPQQPMAMHDLSQLADTLAAEQAPPAKQASPSAPVVAALNGQTIKLPGYLVPLAYNEEGQAEEFLLVPYFGACIHVPPPPSNQIVYITAGNAVDMEALYQPFWIEGQIHAKSSSSELAEAGYQVLKAKIYPYEM